VHGKKVFLAEHVRDEFARLLFHRINLRRARSPMLFRLHDKALTM
jgi:hypothetical protein